MRRSLRFAAGAVALAAGVAAVPTIGALTAQATIDGDGHVVVYRVGDGSAPLDNSATPVFLDEYALDGTPVESLALPTSASGSQHALTATGLSRSEGLISRSPDGRYLTVTGYDAAPGTTGPGGVSLTASDPANRPRTIGIVDGNNTIDTSTTLTGSTAPQIIRSATTVDAGRIWTAGGNGGVGTVGFGGTNPLKIAGIGSTNLNGLSIVGNQLFSSNSANDRLTEIGSGLPKTAGSALTALPAGAPTATQALTFGLPYGYVLLDLDPAVNFDGTGADTLYYIDAADQGGTVHKARFNGTSWQDKGSVDLEEGFGLTAIADGTSVTLVATTPTSIVKLIDGNGMANTFAPTVSTIATASDNTEFRGVAVAPINPAGPTVLLRKPTIDGQIAATQASLAVSVDVNSTKTVQSVTASVDGGTEKAAALTTGDTYTVNVPLKGLTSGKHTVSVTATDADGTRVVSRQWTYKPVVVPAGDIGPGIASLANNGKVTVNGFNTTSYTGSPNGSGLTSAGTGTASFTFYGRSLLLSYEAANDRGKFSVTIDGKTTNIDSYSASKQKLSKLFGNLALKAHNVTIKGLDAKSAASTGKKLVLGYVTVGQW